MDRAYLSAVGLVGYGGLLLGVYLVQAQGADLASVLRIGPFLLIAGTIAYAGIWLLRHPTYRGHADWVAAWTVGGGSTFMALSALVVLNHWVAVATTSPAAMTILDTVTGGSLAGVVAGLYDAQSRQRNADLQLERDKVERFANKAESLNRYAQALNESTHLDEISALSLEVVQLLIGSRDAAFLVVEDGSVRSVDSTLPDSTALSAIARDVASEEPLTNVRCPAETDSEPPVETDIETIVAVPIPAGDDRTAVLLAVPETRDAYTEEDVDLLELLSAHMATALPDVDSGTVDPRAP